MTSPYHEDAPTPEEAAPPTQPSSVQPSSPAGKKEAARSFEAIPLLDFATPPRLFLPQFRDESQHHHPRPRGAGASIRSLPRTAKRRPPRSRDLDASAAPDRMGKLIDFEEAARQRLLREMLLLGQFCPLCMLRRLIERYPRFFMGEPGKHFPSPASNGADGAQEGRP